MSSANDRADGATADIELAYRSYGGNVRRYIERTFGMGPPEPEDAVQAAFEKFAQLPGRDQIANPQAFLLSSARNYVLDQRRRLKVRATHAADERHIANGSDDFDAERVFSAKERWKVLEEAIKNMDARRQEILILNRIHGLSCAEIARRKGMSQTLVKTLLGQAVLQCERALRKVGGL